METPQGRRALVPVVYGGIVFLLLMAGLFFRGFTRGVGDASVAGRYTLLPLLGSHSLDSLTFTWNGLSLHFSRSSSPGLADFQSDQGTDDIVLAGGARLRLTPGTDVGGSLTISSAVPAGGAPSASLVVPYTVAGMATEAPAGAALAWQSGGKTYLLTLPASARLDDSAGTMTLPIGGGTWTAALATAGTPALASVPRASSVSPPAARPVSSSRLPAEKDLPTAAQLEASVTRWLDAAYAGWSTSRVSSQDGLWSMPGSSPGFSEDLGVGLLAESVARGTWKTVFPLWQDALAQARARPVPPSLAYSTSVYDGATRDYVRTFSITSSALVQQARAFLASGDNAFLRVAGVIPLLLDHGTPEDFTAARAFLTGRSVAALDVPGAVGLLAALTALAEGIDTSDPVRRSLTDVVSRRLLPSVRTTDAGLFLETTPGVIDTAASLRCGALLIRAGASLPDTRTAAVGRALVVSALSLGDGSGTLPAALTLSAGRIAARSGVLAAESVYAVVPAGRQLPRETPLARQVASGISLWAAADLLSATRVDATIRIILGYPAGVPHYFAIQGLPAFTQVRMHGIAWHADPSYGKYSDGWSFDDAGGVFYGKLTGRSDQEEIDITF